MFHIYMNQGLRPFIRLLVLAFLSIFMTAPSSGGGQVWEPWSFRDGSLVVSEQKDQIFFSFPYVPLLDSIPAWVPAFPRHYLQAQEPVLPWNGLGGILQIGFIEDSSGLVVLGKNSISSPERTPVSFSGRISRGHADGTLEWFINPDEKGVRFQYVNSGTSEVTLGLSLHPFMQAQIWQPREKRNVTIMEFNSCGGLTASRHSWRCVVRRSMPPVHRSPHCGSGIRLPPE
ncbi:MAG: hypothetical protein UZ16_OP3001003132 [Candidatus Hinthialibacteria bacterium OLB16]|nr:MAG: hypothetical protein UZ16_OP3001003132 [Candidatus Hinthialibacteria bacterium OLB16]